MKRLLQLLRENAAQERKPLNLVRNEAATDATLYIYDVIDPYWGVSAEAVAKAISGLDASVTLHVHINSPGGDVFEGRAIRTAIQQHRGKTIAHIDGLAASAATTISDGADEVEIATGAFYMIHNGWTWMYGNKNDFRKEVDLLEKIDAAIVADYASRTGLDVAQLVQWMDDETWFSAEEAVQHGFATRLMEAPDKGGTSNRAGLANQCSRQWNLAAFEHAPQALTTPRAPEPNPAIEAAAQRARNERRLQLLNLID